ncbi:peptide chain release factor N(5)-glutamine methyltransferase [soil metagenome]
MTATAGQDQQSWTIGSLLDWTAGFLLKKGAESPRLDAEVLLASVLGCRRIELYTRHTEPAAEEVRERFRDLIRRRTEGCPVAYLVGQKEFYSLTFEVNNSVLIPRPDSEHVVLETLRVCKGLPAPRILDLGVGSGNLSVSLAFHLKNAQVVAVDISPDALTVAKRNATKHGVDQRVQFLEGDLFEPLPQGAQFDAIVSNPPYVPTADVATLETGVAKYEPKQALDGGASGFDVFDRILAGALTRLAPGGSVVIEIGSPQHEEARRKIEVVPEFELFDTIYDSSRHPRVLRARKR